MATRVLITGGLGLIGSHLLARTPSRHRFVLLEEIAPDPDLLVPNAPVTLVEQARPDVVLHLAWAASSTPGYRQHPDNPRWVEATQALAQACLARGIWFIGTGTVAELDATNADAYTLAKTEVFRRLGPDIEAGRLTWLRPHYVFDPGLGRPEVMAEILQSIAQSRTPLLRSPEAAHDFVHVQDVAAAIDTVLAEELLGLVPIGSGTSRTVAALARAAGAAGVPDVAAPSQASTFTADISRLTAHQWSPRSTEEYFDD